MIEPIVELVARAIYESSARTVADTRPEWEALDGVSQRTFSLHARAALEASHHAELVEALGKLANENSSFVVGPSARRYIRAVLAKIGGAA